MSRTVFILGAGASREAGGPLMADFLDVAEALRQGGHAGPDADSFDLVFKAIGALQAVHSKSTMDLENIESVFAAFEMASLFGKLGDLDPREVQELGTAIRRLIVRTLEMRIDFRVVTGDQGRWVIPPAPYDNFVKLVREISASGAMTVSVITFNYDVALDFAFHWDRMLIDYCTGSEVDRTRIQVMKLHGSVNWARCSECQSIIPWHLNEFFSKFNWNLLLTDAKSVHLPIASKLPSFEHCGRYALSEPAIVPPTWNKTQYQRDIAPVWRQASQNLSDAENIFVIGYSLSETDHFFRYLYALGTVGETRLKRLWVFDPDPSGQVRARYENLLGPMARNRFLLKQKKFSEAMSIIRSELNIVRA